MRIKELNVNVRISQNYNSYECGVRVDLEESEEPFRAEIRKKLFDECKRAAYREALEDAKDDKSK